MCSSTSVRSLEDLPSDARIHEVASTPLVPPLRLPSLLKRPRECPRANPPKFPYALHALPAVLATQWTSPTFIPYRQVFPLSHRTSPSALQSHVEELTQRDVKIAYLKDLQGFLWEEGFAKGEFATPLFPDVVPRLREWRGGGVGLGVYSSGSVFAQKLLFRHVSVGEAARVDGKGGAGGAVDGQVPGASAEAHLPAETEDLRYLMTVGGWFDTTNAGLKTEASSYGKIVETLGWQPAGTLFLTDNVREYDAAASAGLCVILLDRPGNAPVSAADRARMDVVQSFYDIDLAEK
ncbi:enolase-phosphatase E1 [Friedmanniomyces endolithicus]|nr:enolase-phosphatase E1 [Friedmanniomyces endolithicus]KAK0867925.1 enolase-phosphatase E1 [Friedmanniomyces endolithicus]KAK0905432.1 enolase-phosphatase E1 [Friedmanniomyces endolithicus]KAK0978307.1 enolase-phosphatase E1 [Friedmanniomyces endolithicus]